MIDWLTKFQCKLINILNEIIFSKQCIMKNDQNQTSTLIIDLTIATSHMINKITNWSINKNAVTESNDEIIEFSIIRKNIETVDNFINNVYNVNKTDWKKFEKYLKLMYDSNIISMQKLIENFISINLKNEIILLQSIINEAANISIFKRKSCEKFKKWWCDRLITLKKTMTVHKKFYKRYYSNFDFDNFKKTRNEYFHEIRKIKKLCWIEFLENAVDKIFFLIYKFTKNNRIEKLSSINHNEKICIDFDQKCNAFINVMFLFFSKIQKNSTDHFITYEFSVEKWMPSWSILIESEISSAIFTSAFKKTSESNNLIFLIIQKAYKIISKLFFMIFSCLINNKIHSICWRIDIEAILKKIRKIELFYIKIISNHNIAKLFEKSFEKNYN